MNPKKAVSVKVNGSSLQVFRLGVYAGSISLAELCLLIQDAERKRYRLPKSTAEHSQEKRGVYK